MVGRFLLHMCTYTSLAVTLTACDPCDNRVLQELPNSTGTTKVVIFQRSCGPIGGTSTQISVLPASTQRLIAGGNAFSADTADGTAPALPSGGPPVVVTWANPQELYVATIPVSACFKHRNRSMTFRFRFAVLTSADLRHINVPVPASARPHTDQVN